MRLILTCFLLLLTFVSRSQAYNLDQFYNSGYEPEALNSTSQQRINEMYRDYSRAYGLSIADSVKYRPFALKYNYYLEKLNKSGKLFFGDEVSTYLNDLKNFLLRDDPLRDFVHVYLVNFAQINAFTNDFGNIYVNVGTLAKLETEEQLLMVLAHEISHILLRHSLKTDVYIDSLKNRLMTDNAFEGMESHLFSQQQELQADSLGLKLLMKSGIDLSGVPALFDRLARNFDPLVSGKVDPAVFGFNDPLMVNCFKEVSDLYENKQYQYKVVEDLSASTHPSSGERLRKFGEWKKEVPDSKGIPPGDFNKIKALSSMLYINTLMTSGYHVDALYQTLKFLEASPDDLFLRKAQLKLMLLITQGKYRMEFGDQIINDHGNECTDTNYLAFRATILSFNALDMNLLTCRSAGVAKQRYQDEYMGRVEHIAYEFLYKHNPHIFVPERSGSIRFIAPQEGTVISEKQWDLHKFYSAKEKMMFDTMTKEGYAFVDAYIKNSTLLSAFIEGFNSQPELNEVLAAAVSSYRKLRRTFEKTLTVDRYPRSLHPVIAYEYYKKAKIDSEIDFTQGKRLALIESTSYFYKAKKKELQEVDLDQTLVVEGYVSEGIRNNRYFEYNLSSDDHSSKKTVAVNYMHYCFSVWVNESFSLEDLNFSSVDEEVYQYQKKNEVDYLVYNINVMARNKGLGKKYYGIFYYLYLDLKTGGIVYTAKIPTKTKPTRKQIELIQFVSNAFNQKR